MAGSEAGEGHVAAADAFLEVGFEHGDVAVDDGGEERSHVRRKSLGRCGHVGVLIILIVHVIVSAHVAAWDVGDKSQVDLAVGPVEGRLKGHVEGSVGAAVKKVRTWGHVVC